MVMTVATAGHPPPFLARKRGQSEFLDTSGGLLGVFEDEVYEQTEVQLALGDRLLFYTDGFEQAFHDDGRKDENRCRANSHYRSEFRKLGEVDDPQEMIDTICRRLDMQQGSLHQADDLTLLCVQTGVAPQEGKIAA